MFAEVDAISAHPWPFVILVWAGTFAVIGAYAFWVMRGGRSLTRIVPPQRRRWASLNDEPAGTGRPEPVGRPSRSSGTGPRASDEQSDG